MTQVTNVYLKEIYANLPRILSLYDLDELSPFYGVGDRDYWGWKTKDFINGTYQGVAHGLSLLIKHDLLPDYLKKPDALHLIDAVFHGTKTITRKDGSLEEAYPFEKSFCVTSLIAYDLAETLHNLKDDIDAKTYQNYISVIEPLIDFTLKNDEGHGIISNHLASAAAALASWQKISAIKIEKEKQLLDIILNHQSDEGWFKEYSGADIGYQTLATSYLAALDRHTPSLHVNKSIEKSLGFLKYFIHPDGSIGGIYGARNTEFYYPDAFEYYADTMPDAMAISYFMRHSIGKQNCVTLSSIDTPNIIPMFNSYCRAAVFYNTSPIKETPKLPFEFSNNFLRFFEDCGLVIKNYENYYAVFSTIKGGAGIICDKATLKTERNFGPLYQNEYNQFFTTQSNEDKATVTINDSHSKIEIVAPLFKYKKMYPTPVQYIILRCLNLTLMRCSFLNELVKKLLVHFVIKGKKASIGTNKRVISFTETVHIDDAYQSDQSSLNHVSDSKRFYAIHMASQGYWKR